MAVTVEQLREILSAACQAIVDAKEELGEADRATGDGDHGTGMSRGFGAFLGCVGSGPGCGREALADGCSSCFCGRDEGVEHGLLTR